MTLDVNHIFTCTRCTSIMRFPRYDFMKCRDHNRSNRHALRTWLTALDILVTVPMASPSSRHMTIGPLLLPESAFTNLDACMVDRPKISGHFDDEICGGFVLDVLAR